MEKARNGEKDAGDILAHLRFSSFVALAMSPFVFSLILSMSKDVLS
jgi:hypothetical protein